MMNMNKVEVGLAIAVVGIVLFVGGMIYYEQAGQMEEWMDEHPGEELEIGGPPVITDLRLVAIVVVVAAVFCGICLKLPVKENDDENNL